MDTLWFSLSLGAAFLMASNAAFMKRFFSDISPWDMAVIPFFFATPFCLTTLFFIEVPPISDAFYLHLIWVIPLTSVAMVLHFRAIHMSPLSLTMPFLAFTPVFVIITGHTMLDESLGAAGIIGILLVVTGGYVLNIDSARYGLFGPIRAVFKEPGSALMLLVAALYGLCSVGGKLLIINSSPLFAAMLVFSIYGPIIAVTLVAAKRASLKTITARPRLGFIVGFMIFAEIICHNFAISMVEAAYMVTIKRLAGFFSVLYGWMLFHERGIRYRLIGTLIMTVGAIIIVLKA